MAQFFSAYEVTGNSAIPAYFIESTAPDNIDDKVHSLPTPPGTVPIPPDAAIDKIVGHLAASPNPNLVIAVHGFNSPRDAVLGSYGRAFNAIDHDPTITGHGAVCIGYRWPSERIGVPWPTAFTAAPMILVALLVSGAAFFALGVLIYFFVVTLINGIVSFFMTIAPILFVGEFLHYLMIVLAFIAVVSGTVALVSPIILLALRIVVYFRDSYRATSYGVPDLVEIIRQIDLKLTDRLDEGRKVELSFMGHSMGAYVVTDVVRILSDVFSPDSIRVSLEMDVRAPIDVSPNIGHVFRLARLVLISPDIPAETLMSGRANFLAASLHRFNEVFLFSNEGDEVLRQISTMGNYFSFPTRENKFGYRLGNVGVLAAGYGVATGIDLDRLRIGYATFGELYHELTTQTLQTSIPECFSYFDCTDGVENGKGVVTFANPGRQNKIGWPEHLWLLLNYLFVGKPDVHSGYFSADFFKQIIYRLACTGLADTIAAYGGTDRLNSVCREHQIKAMLK